MFNLLHKKKMIELQNRWCLESTTFEVNSDFIEITLPLIDLNHDRIQLFLDYSSANGYYLTDDGDTLDELEMRGINIFESQNRKKHFNQMIKEFGVQHDHESNELIIKVKNIEDFPKYQITLAQCCSRIYGFLLTSRNSVINYFSEEVESFFVANNINFQTNKEMTGKSGVSHVFDYSLKSKVNNKNQLIQTINNPQSADFKSNLFSILDIDDSKRKDTEFIILGNDGEGEFSQNFIQVANSYDVDIKKWSQREIWKEEFSA